LGHGGEVVGNNIRCPFHHWQFDADGWTKDVPYGNTPKICERQSVLRTLPTQERYGLIWAWYHPDNAEPSFSIPDVPELESDNYIEPRLGEWTIDTCIQELGENSVDCPHIKYLHRSPIMPEGVSSADGHIFNFDIYVDEHMKVLGKSYGPSIQVIHHVHGDTRILMFAIPLPITTESTLSRYLFTFEKHPKGSEQQIKTELLYDQAIGSSDLGEAAGFAEVDIPVWNHKKYRHQPILCDGDGPIAQWRKYFSQFYAEKTPS
jgi:phenylpropionate dioxygenase-like ring-hydroxylating dioxygenase large terminal subunit